MDLNERKDKDFNRHPWELSRTRCIRGGIGKYLDVMHRKVPNRGMRYINVGAGDCFFDQELLARYADDEVYAVDIGYENVPSDEGRIHRYNYLEEIPDGKYDYAIMMDSLEYMEDDAAYVKKVTERLRKGGWFFFTLPAYPSLFSDHDVHVKNLRRYSRQSFHALVDQIPELKIREEYCFYTSLFMVRYLQKKLRIPIDPNNNVTTKWKYRENHFVTRLVAGCLDLDFRVNKMCSRIGIRLPGLSLLVICRKV